MFPRRWRPAIDGDAPAGHVIETYQTAHHGAWMFGATRLAGELRPGTISVLPDGYGGVYRCGPLEVAQVRLTPRRLQANANDRRVELHPQIGVEDATAARLIEVLADEANEESATFVDQGLDLLCLHLIRKHAAVAAPRRGLARWQLERAFRYLHAHLGTNVDLGELAAVVGLSRYHFSVAFKLATGETPHGALTRIRIDRARELLADPALAVTEVALAVGFQTPSAFAATFRRLVATSPSAYRRRL